MYVCVLLALTQVSCLTLALTHYAAQDGIVLPIFLPPLPAGVHHHQVYMVQEVNQTQGFLSFLLSEARIITSSALVSSCILTHLTVKSLSCPVVGMLTFLIFSACWPCSFFISGHSGIWEDLWLLQNRIMAELSFPVTMWLPGLLSGIT